MNVTFYLRELWSVVVEVLDLQDDSGRDSATVDVGRLDGAHHHGVDQVARLIVQQCIQHHHTCTCTPSWFWHLTWASMFINIKRGLARSKSDTNHCATCPCTHFYFEIERERQRQTDRQRQREREKETERQRERDMFLDYDILSITKLGHSSSSRWTYTILNQTVNNMPHLSKHKSINHEQKVCQEQQRNRQRVNRNWGRACGGIYNMLICGCFVHSCGNETQCTGTQCLDGMCLRVRALPLSHTRTDLEWCLWSLSLWWCGSNLLDLSLQLLHRGSRCCPDLQGLEPAGSWSLYQSVKIPAWALHTLGWSWSRAGCSTVLCWPARWQWWSHVLQQMMQEHARKHFRLVFRNFHSGEICWLCQVGYTSTGHWTQDCKVASFNLESFSSDLLPSSLVSRCLVLRNEAKRKSCVLPVCAWKISCSSRNTSRQKWHKPPTNV